VVRVLRLSPILSLTSAGLSVVLVYSYLTMITRPLLQVSPGSIGYAVFYPFLSLIWIAFFYIVVASVIASGIELATSGVGRVLTFFGLPIPTTSAQRAFGSMFTAIMAYLIVQNVLSIAFGCTAAPTGIACPVPTSFLLFPNPLNFSNLEVYPFVSIPVATAVYYVAVLIKATVTHIVEI